MVSARPEGQGWQVTVSALAHERSSIAEVAGLQRSLDEVRALADGASVLVTGRVPDVRPYLKFAAVAVATLRIARGVQNKVLEAMAALLNAGVVPVAVNTLMTADDYAVDGFHPNERTHAVIADAVFARLTA